MSTTIATLANVVQERLEETPGSAGAWWSAQFEIYSALMEAQNDLLLLIGRPTQYVNIPFTVTPNSVWQTVPKGLMLITDIQGFAAPLYKINLWDLDYLQTSWGCYDDQTEVLTDQGWRRFEELDGTETIATLKDGVELEYQKPTAYQTYNYNGILLSYQSNSVDILVTPNHRLYFRPMDQDGWRLSEAGKTKIRHFHMKKNAAWIGREREFIEIAGKIVPMDLWLEFLGYYISEGSTHHSVYDRPERKRTQKYKSLRTGKVRTSVYTIKATRQPCHRVSVSQSEKSDAYRRIEACLKSLPFGFFRSGKEWRVENRSLYDELVGLGRAHEKHIPEYVMGLSPRQLTIIYRAMMAGDGTEQRFSAAYYTSSPRLADQFQELLLKIGMAGDIHVTNRIGRNNGCGGTTRFLEYIVGVRRKHLTPRKGDGGWKPTKIPYTGRVFCVTVPNHVIYVRRNGKAVWCGNSDWTQDVDVAAYRWAPISLNMFVIHPAVSTAQTVNLTAIQYPTSDVWPYTGSETVQFEDNYFQLLEEYAAFYCRIKELGGEFQEGMKLFDQYMQGARRMTQIQDLRDPLLFTSGYGAAQNANPTTRR